MEILCKFVQNFNFRFFVFIMHDQLVSEKVYCSLYFTEALVMLRICLDLSQSAPS